MTFATCTLLCCLLGLMGTVADTEGDNREPALQETSRRDANVAFCASVPQNFNWGITQNTILVFERLFMNKGDGYNRETGIFQAPQAGAYQFYWSLFGASNYRTETALYVNLNPLVSSNDTGASRTQSGNSAIVDLKMGDQVAVVIRRGSRLTGSLFASFSGHLLADTDPKFFVSSTEDSGESWDDKVLLYNNINLNPDNHFNPTSATFIAPVHGIYRFIWAGTSASSRYSSYTALEVNGAQIVGAQEASSSWPSMALNSAVVEMQAGQSSRVILKGGHRIQHGGEAFNSPTTTFSGQMMFDLTSSGGADKIAFMAIRTTDSSLYDHIFNTVVTNIGGAYNTSTGRFTAPVRGVYQIQVGGRASRSNGNLRIRRNGSELAWASSSYQRTSITQSIIVELSVGDYMDIYAPQPLTSGTGANTFSTFSGGLLFLL